MQTLQAADDTSRLRLLEQLDRELMPLRLERYRDALVRDLARELHRFGCRAVVTPIQPNHDGGPDFRIDFEPLE